MKTKLYHLMLSVFILAGCQPEENKGSADEAGRTAFFPKAELKPADVPAKERVWAFILAGQSNMAGRGQVEPADTIPHPRILSINKNGELIMAKEPLHFYEPTMTGLDCGLSFGRALLPHIPDSISILLIPTAVGGSAIGQWVNDSTFRNVALLSNLREKVAIAKNYGKIQGILWHQGESDAGKSERIEVYDQQLQKLFALFRAEAGDNALPIFIGELGSFSKKPENWQAINNKIRSYASTDSNAYIIKTNDFFHKGDSVHFNAEGQRLMGQRFANEFVTRKK